jgi:predicted nuclease of predicted toxin-antitoxin system
MRLLVDENLPCDLAISARKRGLEAVWVRAILPRGKKDAIPSLLFAVGYLKL